VEGTSARVWIWVAGDNQERGIALEVVHICMPCETCIVLNIIMRGHWGLVMGDEFLFLLYLLTDCLTHMPLQLISSSYV
jgi:hypothetical protein